MLEQLQLTDFALAQQGVLATPDHKAALESWRDHLLGRIGEGVSLLTTSNVDTTASDEARVKQFSALASSVVDVVDKGKSQAVKNNVSKFLLHLCWHESAFLTTRVQGKKGPAKGLAQFEAYRAREAGDLAWQNPAYVKSIVEWSGAMQSDLRQAFSAIPDDINVPYFPNGNLIANLLGLDSQAVDIFCVGLLRIELTRFAEAIPTTNNGHADYWYKYWKRSGGDPVALKKRFVEEANRADKYLIT